MTTIYRQKSKLTLYVPTRGRVERQFTIENLHKDWRARTVLVCPRAEMPLHAARWGKHVQAIIGQPDPNMTIAAKRAWIFKEAHRRGHDKIMMLDDDLRFGHRIAVMDYYKGFGEQPKRKADKEAWEARIAKWPDLGKLETIHDDNPKQKRMFDRIEWMLTIYSHGGIGARLMNQTFNREFSMNMRSMYAIAFWVPDVLAHCKLGRIEHREDLDYTLQLMTAGLPNALYTWGSVEQERGFNYSVGGVQEERTMRAANRDAYRLAKLHPGIVTVAERDYKVSTKRVEVRVAWKKAIQIGESGLL